METQNVQFLAPFSVRDQSSGTALRARLGDTKAELYTPLEVNGTARVTGALTANDTLKVGVYPPAGETVAVDGTVGATGNISTAAQVTAQTMLCNGELRVVNKIRCNVLEAEAGTQVICQDAFSVDGALTVSGDVSSAGQVAAQTMYCNANLTVNGSIVGWSPFWVAGMVDGNANVLASKGKVAFTCTRETTGNYRVNFASPHPNGATYVVTVSSISVNQWVDQLATSSFLAVTRNSSVAAQNATFFFTVLA
jgi:cytoskeletal protein CcmA (bactofilin family)